MTAHTPAPHHHPDPAVLLDYAAGSLREPLALAVATHLWFCRACRDTVANAEAVGGAFLAALPAASDGDIGLAEVLALLDEPASVAVAPRAPAAADIPGPLRHYVHGALPALPWRTTTKSLATVDLTTDVPGYRVRLLRIAAGAAMPPHTHRGTEVTVVLKGGYSDKLGRFAPGDVAATDPTIAHQPVADADQDCYCLAVTDAPVRLVGWLGVLLNPLVRF